MNITTKPIKKCNGCELNFKKYCGVFEIPRMKWEKGVCSGYNSEELIMKFRSSTGAPAAKESARRKRREVQALRKTEDHLNGSLYTVVTADNPQSRKKASAMASNYSEVGKRRSKIARLEKFAARRPGKQGKKAVK